jgi:hypothetical protein
MNTDHKIKIILGLLIYLVLSDIVKDMYHINVWFQRRFADQGTSLRYGK